MTANGYTPSVLALDAGGTMTDALLVDKGGEFQVGKALTTSENEAIGVMNSFADALKHWSLPVDAGAQSLEAVIYSGTAMINRILTHQGVSPLGLTPGGLPCLRPGKPLPREPRPMKSATRSCWPSRRRAFRI